jgi:hypothetical protein
MTEEVEAAAPAVPVEVGEHTCGEGDGHTTYPAALASQEAVCESEELFTRLLQDLNAKLQTAQPKKFRPSKYRVPTGEQSQAAVMQGQQQGPETYAFALVLHKATPH